MIIPDANLLIFAVNKDAPDHEATLQWWQGLLRGQESLGLLSTVAFSFVRIATNVRILPKPLSVAEAFRYVENWLTFPNVLWIEPQQEDFSTVRKLLLSAKSAGANLVTDAQIAATALRLHATVHTTDTDFARFSNIRWLNPLHRERNWKL